MSGTNARLCAAARSCTITADIPAVTRSKGNALLLTTEFHLISFGLRSVSQCDHNRTYDSQRRQETRNASASRVGADAHYDTSRIEYLRATHSLGDSGQNRLCLHAQACYASPSSHRNEYLTHSRPANVGLPHRYTALLDAVFRREHCSRSPPTGWRVSWYPDAAVYLPSWGSALRKEGYII